MTSNQLTDAARQAVMLGLETAGPVLLLILVVGLVVGTLQAATQIQDQSIGLVVRLLAVVTALVVLVSARRRPPAPCSWVRRNRR